MRLLTKISGGDPIAVWSQFHYQTQGWMSKPDRTTWQWFLCLSDPAAAQVYDDAFKDCVALHAQYVFDTFGKFPGTVPSIFVMEYLQAHHLDLDFYDRFYTLGSYLGTHADHMARWHPEQGI
jgi:hypothetical protein